MDAKRIGLSGKDSNISGDSITKEIKWGQEYRTKKEKERRKSLQPKVLRINEEETWQRYQLTKELEELKRLDKMLFAKPVPKFLRLPKLSPKKAARFDRCKFNKKQYIDFLSTPRYVAQEPNYELRDKIRKKMQKQTCSARIEALALPTFAHLIHTWKTYGSILSPEVKSKFGEILSSDHNLNMKYAKCYFKSMDYLRKKERAERRRKHRRKLKKLKRLCKKEFRKRIAKVANAISECIEKEPLFTINYKQTLISDAIFKAVAKAGYIKKIPNRTSSSVYKRTLVDLVDQIAVCIDIVGLHMDVKLMGRGDALEPSLQMSYEEQQEEEGEEEAEKERERFSLPPFNVPPFPPLPPIPQKLSPQKLVSLFEKGEGYEGESTESIVRSMQGLTPQDETLDTLITLLSRTPAENLQQSIQPDMLPGFTYGVVLSKIKELSDREKAKKEELRRNILKESILIWAYDNAAEDVDDDIKQKIFEIADVLSRRFSESEFKN